MTELRLRRREVRNTKKRMQQGHFLRPSLKVQGISMLYQRVRCDAASVGAVLHVGGLEWS